MKMKKSKIGKSMPNVGDAIMTPRFMTVHIKEVFDSYDDMVRAGYNEPTHYRGDFWINGKILDEYHMHFACSPNPDWYRASTKKSKKVKKSWGGAVGDKLAELFDKKLPDGTPLVPPEGDASTDIGQLVRGMNKIMYRYYNDGDIAGIGYGRDTLDWVFDYMKENANGEIYNALENFYDKYSSYDFEYNFKEMSESEREDYVNEALGTDFSYRYGDEDEPEEPDRDDYDSDEEYEDAMDSYEQEKEEYDERMEKRNDFDYYMDEPSSFIMDYGEDYINSAIKEAESAGYERDMIALASMIVNYVESKWIQMFNLDQANEEDIDNYATDSWDYYASARKSREVKKSKKSKVKKLQMARSHLAYDIIDLPDEIVARCPDGSSFELTLKPTGSIGYDYRYHGTNTFVDVDVTYRENNMPKSSPEDLTDILTNIMVRNTRCFDPINDDGSKSITLINASISEVEDKIEEMIGEGWDKFLDYSKISSTKKSVPKLSFSFEDHVSKVRKSNYAKTGNINQKKG